jgi:hypothetical protein
MTTKILVTQIDTRAPANVALAPLPAGTTFTAGDNISITEDGRISSADSDLGLINHMLTFK